MKANALSLLVLLLVPVPAAATEIQQIAGDSSRCIPVQNGNNNQLTCNGVDPRAEARLNEVLDLKDLNLKQKTVEANEWAKKYTELNAQFEETKERLISK